VIVIARVALNHGRGTISSPGIAAATSSSVACTQIVANPYQVRLSLGSKPAAKRLKSASLNQAESHCAEPQKPHE
jgi:hypothetical protein